MRQDGDDVLLAVRAQPRARENGVAAVREGVVLVRVTAAPEAGKANEAIRRVLSKATGIPRSRVTIERGGTARDKLVRLRDASLASVRERLAPP